MLESAQKCLKSVKNVQKYPNSAGFSFKILLTAKSAVYTFKILLLVSKRTGHNYSLKNHFLDCALCNAKG